MEQRRNERFSSYRDIGIEYPGGRTVFGTIRDVSIGGIFIELCTTDLPSHALVQLHVPTNDRERGAIARIAAAVTRRTNEGIGVIFCGSHGNIPEHMRAWFGCAEQVLRASAISRERLGCATA